MSRRAGVVKIAVSDTEKATLRKHAGGRAVAAYLRNLALGSRPSAPQHADDWWASLPPGRREQIHQWVAGATSKGHDPIPGQSAMTFED